MSDTAPTASLATRARRLTALARARRDDRDVSQAQGQVQTAINKLDQELRTLSSVLDVHRKLKKAGVPVTDPGHLEQPVKRLKEQAGLGRPTAQFLNARTRDVLAARSAIDDANADAWRTWAAQMVDGLPLALQPRVPFSHRRATATRISNMKTRAARKPSIADITEFQRFYDRVKEELAAVDGASIDALLNRFTDGRILLADLSDAELEMLREDASLSDQLYLHIAS
ncbi:hypothetical protein ACQBAU_00410 [Propionibacteriaceae bacterium Y2011]